MVNSTLQNPEVGMSVAAKPLAAPPAFTSPAITTSWKPTGDPVLTFANPSHEFAVGDAYGAAVYDESGARDPMRVGAIWVSVLVVATAAYSLIFGSTI